VTKKKEKETSPQIQIYRERSSHRKTLAAQVMGNQTERQTFEGNQPIERGHVAIGGSRKKRKKARNLNGKRKKKWLK